MSSVVYAVELNGERVEFKSNPTNLFPDLESATKARDSGNAEVKQAVIVPYRLTQTVVV